MIKAIIFDCFGVLTTDGWRQIREEILTDPDAREQARALDRAVNVGEMNYDDFVTEIASLTGLSIADTRTQLINTAPNTRLFEFIRDELKPHYQIGLLSNAADNWLDDLFLPWQVELFDDTVLSYAVGMIKPQPDIYDLMATKLGVLPEECVFIDDIERYVTAAVDVGMKGVVFTDTDQTIAAIKEVIA